MRGAVAELASGHSVSPPLFLIPPAARPAIENAEHEVKPIPRPRASQFPPSQVIDRALQATFPALLKMPDPSKSFDGVGQGFTGHDGTFTVQFAPPDTNGDVGPNHYVQLVNTDIAVFDKNGVSLYGPVPLNTLWHGFGGGCETNNDGDPVVIYDSIADRWVISQFSVSTTPFLQCVAVSVTNSPIGSYSLYSFTYSDFPDYPKMGVWPDAYYQTFNMFNAAGTAFLGSKICAYDRAAMLAGQAAAQQCFQTPNTIGGLLPADLDGPNQPPAGSPGYAVALGASANQLAFYKFHVDWATPGNTTFTGPTNLTTASFTEACSGGTCIKQSGTNQKLDSLADRLMFRLAYRNFGDHEAMVVSHSIANGSPVNGSAAIRWYELRFSGVNPIIYQQGTYAPDTNYRWMPSIAMDQQGNMALGFSVSSSSLKPQIRYTGRLVTDTLGQMSQGENTIIAGLGSQTTGLSRWGDYSMMAIDPSDDCTFWFTTEYIPSNGTFNWKTRIGSFKFPNCAPPGPPDFNIGANPATLTIWQGSAGTSAISTTQVGGPGTVVLAADVSPADQGVTALLNPGSVAAGSGSTLTVTVGAAAILGTYTVTVTGTEAGAPASKSTSVAVTVTAPPAPDFTISANPAALTITQGGTGTSAIGTTQVYGPGTVSLAAVVSPIDPGVTATVNPSSVAAGSGATLTVTTAATATPGTYTVAVNGTEGDNKHSASVTVTVNAPSNNPVLNGGFENGLTSWTPAGVYSISATARSGAASAMIGSTSPSNTSTLTQTFNVPSAGGTLTFYYKMTCPDTVTYDWFTATVKDNSTAKTVTVQSKVCATNASWVKVTYALTTQKGHSVTLTLTNKDDNYAADPSYTLVDDVSVQ